MPPFKDEHILLIVPGSQTTLAQLGLPESFTPPQHRFRSRVFLSEDGKTYDPHKLTKKKREDVANDTDVEMLGVESEDVYIEDPDDEDGAIWPLKEGRIVNQEAFFALLQYVHASFSPQLHTPVMLIAQPCWTAKDQENITTFIFERFKTPALCIMDSALATSYAFGIPHATIVDVGYEKVDVTAITEFQISGRGTVSNSGGEAMTQNLVKLLKEKNFSRDMAEQLKLSSICEVLPPGTPLPGTEVPEEVISNPAAAASTGATSSGPDVKITEPPRPVEPDVVEDDEVNGEEKHIDDEGVLDIASIVTSGKTQDFLAKKEKEKAERAAVRKANKEAAAEAAAAAAKPVRLPNSKRTRAIFHYEEIVKDAPNAKRQKTPEPEVDLPITEDAAAPAVEPKPSEETGEDASIIDDATRREQQKAARKEEKRKARFEGDPDRLRRDIEVGTERFLAADEGYLSAVADTVYRTVMSVDDVSKRQDAWDAVVICGAGSKLRGFKDALIQTLNNRYLVSPSSATMFMSELPSNLATPSGTGSMTPVGSFVGTPQHQPPTASAVNPLLLAATTASNPALNPQFHGSHYQSATHSSHSQSPTSIKVASPPSYFPEWKTFEDAVFLGGQVAAKVIFVVDQGLSKGFLSRVEFNEEGPSGIHQIGLVY